MVETAENVAERLKESEFGYSSVHYQIRHKQRAGCDAGDNVAQGQMAEVQVRTLAQHMWAAVSHQLQYKNEESVPSPLRRAINRVSAVLELVDLEFERVLAQKLEYDSSRSQTDELNVNTVELLLDDLLPKENKTGTEDYPFVVQSLQRSGCQNIGDCRQLILRHKDAVMREERAIMKLAEKGLRYDDSSPPVVTIPGLNFMTSEERIAQGVFYSHTGMISRVVAKQHNPGDDWFGAA